ncbi:hypothetical protein D5086_021876 [Populus alba]|uniref:Uncharacterized protein n=1 Tax=Populus alba TaxID=43335 RepID=A0ACC4BDE8_POPAL
MLSFLKSQDTSKVFTMLASVAASAILVRTIYEAVDTYLVNEVSSSVSRLEVRKDEDMKRLVTNLEINEEIVDIFKNVEARWRLILNMKCWIKSFDHPVTFETLAVDSELKKAVLDDLNTFMNVEEYLQKF